MDENETTYQFPSTDIVVRFADLDASGHLNHASALKYLEQARVRYYRDVIGVSIPDGLGSWALVKLDVNYYSPAFFEEWTRLDLRIPWMRVRSAGWQFRLVTAEGRWIAAGEGVHVHLDPKKSRASPLPEDVRQRIDEFEGIPMCES